MRHALAATTFCVAAAIACPVRAADGQVYRILASGCGPKNTKFSQSAFRSLSNGQIGLVTALHGVVGCRRVTAVQEAELGGAYIDDLTLVSISVAYDLAFYVSPRLTQQPGAPLRSSGMQAGLLRVVGYPLDSARQLEHPLEFFDDPRRTLESQFPGAGWVRQLEYRGSPAVDVPVLLVRGVLQHGYSGAPVVTPSGTVVAVADGGLAEGFAQINWAIPFDNVPWTPYDENDPAIHALEGADAATLFHSPWEGSEERRAGAPVTGTVLYNGSPASNTTRAFAVIGLSEADSRREVPIDFTYDNNTSRFTISDVPPGKFVPSVRLEAAPPFSMESGGDFHDRLSGLNGNLVVAPHDSHVTANLEVVQSIHLTRPVDNQTRRTRTSDPPEALYPSFFAPSAEVFEWDPVPGASTYQVTLLLESRSGGAGRQVLFDQRVTETMFRPRLQVTPPGARYMFSVQAYSASNRLIGVFTHYYLNGSGGWFEFTVIPGRR